MTLADDTFLQSPRELAGRGDYHLLEQPTPGPPR